MNFRAEDLRKVYRSETDQLEDWDAPEESSEEAVLARHLQVVGAGHGVAQVGWWRQASLVQALAAWGVPPRGTTLALLRAPDT